MAEPARPLHDEDEADNNLPQSAMEKAHQKWGMSPEQESKNTEAVEAASRQGDGSAYNRAQQAWGMNPQDGSGLGNANLSQKLDDKYGNYESGNSAKEGLSAGDLGKKEDNSTNPTAEVDAREASLTGDSGSKDINYTGGKKEAEGKSKGKFSAKASFAKKKVQLAVAGMLFSAILSVAAFLGLLPLKLLHIIDNADKKFMPGIEQAVDARSEKFFSRYISSHVLRSLTDPNGTCPNTKINKNCSVTVNEDGPLSRLHRAWADDRLEQKLSANYGIEFESMGSGRYNMVIKGERVDITDVYHGRVELKDVGRSEIRRAWKDGFKNETRLKRMLYHLKVGRLLERKYGIKRCIISCKLSDPYNDWKGNKKRAFQAKLIRRVIAPRDEALSIAFHCIFIEPCGTDPVDTGDDHDKRDKYQKQVKEMLDRLSREYGQEFTQEGVEKMLKELDDLERDSGNGKYKQYLAKKILEKFFKSETADTVAKIGTKALPVIGWIQLASTTIELADKAGPAIRKYRYVAGSMAMVQLYSMYKTHADEIKVGNVDAEMVGSFVEALGDQTPNGEPAEVSPLYESVINGPSRPVYGSLFGGTAYAAETAHQKTYTCDDGNKISPEKYICDEEDLLGGTGIAKFIETISDNGIVDALGPIAGGVNDLLELLPIEEISGVLLNLPGVRGFVGSITSFATDQLEPLMSSIIDYILPSALSASMSGARTVSGIIGGASAAAATVGHYGIGGAAMTVGAIGEVEEKSIREDNERFASLSIKDRLFSKNESRSMISQLALSMPSTQSAMVSSVANFKPTSLFGNFLNMLRPQKVSAAPDPNAIARDPFGTIQYGYAVDDPALNADPDIYTPEYCQQQNEAWADNYSKDEGFTELEIHTVTNPCLLEETAISSAGGFFTDDVIPSKDRITDGASSSASGGECVDGPVPIEETVVVENIRVHKCIETNVREMVLAARAAGLSQFSGGGWRDSSSQIQARINNGCPDIYESSANSCRVPTARPGESLHERGLAIDISCDGKNVIPNEVKIAERHYNAPSNPCWVWLNQNAANYGFSQLKSEAWHWSTSGR